MSSRLYFHMDLQTDAAFQRNILPSSVGLSPENGGLTSQVMMTQPSK